MKSVLDGYPTLEHLHEDDWSAIVSLAGCTLNRSPKKNWVEKSGGLPEYICRIARAIHRKGRPLSLAIASAINTVKRWAAGIGNVKADTRAKAAKAVAQWEAKKVKNKVKKLATSNIIQLSSSFPLEEIEQAFMQVQSEYYDVDLDSNYSLELKEVWTDFLIAAFIGDDGSEWLIKIPFSTAQGYIDFDTPIPVRIGYEEMVEPDSLEQEIDELVDELVDDAEGLRFGVDR